ncbi:MAG: hypothetical protein Q9165_002671 [Trypethelium subeluteriae]
MYTLCKHPEYLQPLRDELLQSGGVHLNHQNNDLPLLDSFLKETGRLNPTFHGFRFASQGGDNAKSESRFSHPSWRFPFWGSVKQACPARFYVADMSKMIIAHFIMNYDFKLARDNVPISFAWGPLRIPHPRMAFHVRKREDTKHHEP